MIRLSRKSEYGLLAVAYLHARQGEEACSVKDIATHFSIPQALLAKVMQRLKRHDVVTSVKGTSGGYVLAADLKRVTFLEFLRLFDDDTALVECLGVGDHGCQQADRCTIRDPIAALNATIERQLRALTLAELFEMSPEHARRVPVERLAHGAPTP